MTAKISAKLGASQMKQRIEEKDTQYPGVLVVHDCEPPWKEQILDSIRGVVSKENPFHFEISSVVIYLIHVPGKNKQTKNNKKTQQSGADA